MGVLKIMDQFKGHVTLEWEVKETEDEAIAAEADKAIAAASKAFDEAKSKGMLTYEIDKKGEGKPIDKFNPQAETIIAMPMVVGG